MNGCCTPFYTSCFENGCAPPKHGRFGGLRSKKQTMKNGYKWVTVLCIFRHYVNHVNLNSFETYTPRFAQFTGFFFENGLIQGFF